MNLLTKISQYFNHSPQEPTQQNKALLSSLLVMAWMVEARDPYTGGHLWRVSRFAQLLAQHAGLAKSEISRITLGGFLHDLGKVGVPDAILGKRDRLTDIEYQVIKTHPDVGWKMLSGHPLAWLAEDAIRAHHETPDGKGYPKGLSEVEIPIDAKIVGICDAFDAMTSTRPYRQGMPINKALTIIEDNLGTQFDRSLGQQFIELGQQGLLDHIVGHSDEGIPLHECMMCGPTLVITRNHQSGDHIYCRSCTGQYSIDNSNGKLTSHPTGNTGTPEQLSLQTDPELITRMVNESADALLQ
ncbi:HD-GYP domain-containing protein [Shewanella sp. MEBiC00475]|uniref:HD-GYP domain-containing protein n=1 Tax=Shewanella sp. MEBiC00475 TaxID=2575361 RepID=UPI001C3052C5|nr:HD-GYP domain-containing protein [Shewanella sp. MEBiC00475]